MLNLGAINFIFVYFWPKLYVSLTLQQISHIFTKIAFKPLHTNLFNIVLLAFFLTLGSAKSYSQDLPSKTNTITPKKQSETLNINAKDLVKISDTLKKDTVKPKKALLESKIKRTAVGYEKTNQKNKQMTLYDKAELYYQDIELKAGIIVLDYEKNEIYAGRL